MNCTMGLCASKPKDVQVPEGKSSATTTKSGANKNEDAASDSDYTSDSEGEVEGSAPTGVVTNNISSSSGKGSIGNLLTNGGKQKFLGALGKLRMTSKFSKLTISEDARGDLKDEDIKRAQLRFRDHAKHDNETKVDENGLLNILSLPPVDRSTKPRADIKVNGHFESRLVAYFARHEPVVKQTGVQTETRIGFDSFIKGLSALSSASEEKQTESMYAVYGGDPTKKTPLPKKEFLRMAASMMASASRSSELGWEIRTVGIYASKIDTLIDEDEVFNECLEEFYQQSFPNTIEDDMIDYPSFHKWLHGAKEADAVLPRKELAQKAPIVPKPENGVNEGLSPEDSSKQSEEENNEVRPVDSRDVQKEKKQVDKEQHSAQPGPDKAKEQDEVVATENEGTANDAESRVRNLKSGAAQEYPMVESTTATTVKNPVDEGSASQSKDDDDWDESDGYDSMDEAANSQPEVDYRRGRSRGVDLGLEIATTVAPEEALETEAEPKSAVVAENAVESNENSKVEPPMASSEDNWDESDGEDHVTNVVDKSLKKNVEMETAANSRKNAGKEVALNQVERGDTAEDLAPVNQKVDLGNLEFSGDGVVRELDLQESGELTDDSWDPLAALNKQGKHSALEHTKTSGSVGDDSVVVISSGEEVTTDEDGGAEK